MRDLHLHLSGGTSFPTLWELLMASGMKIRSATFREFQDSLLMGNKVVDLGSYLKVLHFVDLAQSSPGAVEQSMYDCYKHSYLAGCNYLEIRWCPYKRSRDFQIDFDKLILAANAGIARAKSIYGICGKQIFCLGTDISDVANAAIFKKALQYKDDNVMGIDVAGPQATKNKMIDMGLKTIFKEAKTKKLLRTIHIGETPTESEEEDLEYVVDVLKPDRIGHGVRMYKYPRLLQQASKQGIEFEVCISSNLTTRAVASLQEFKEIFETFERAGVLWSINTDATFPLDTNIAEEHALYNKIKEMTKQP